MDLKMFLTEERELVPLILFYTVFVGFLTLFLYSLYTRSLFFPKTLPPRRDDEEEEEGVEDQSLFHVDEDYDSQDDEDFVPPAEEEDETDEDDVDPEEVDALLKEANVL